MKAGIITIHNSPSYGASLQSFALWKYITLQGVDCEIIDLHRPYQKDYIASPKYKPYGTSNKPSLKSKVKNLIMGLFGKERHFYTDLSKHRFDKFNSVVKYSRTYFGIDDLYQNPPEYDLYITGSDQVWNPFQPYCLEPYFLTFAPKGKRCISYAASIGISELPENVKADFKKWITHYETIAVRELSAKRILDNITDKSISIVCDPTFLLTSTQWRDIAIFPETKQKYILVFSLGKNAQLLNYASKLSQESGLQLEVIAAKSKSDIGKSYTIIDDAGPEEFLGYIANAAMVITDSFHGTVFSIIMEAENFFTYISPDSKRGSRITDLLDTLGLKEHLLDTSLSTSFSELNGLKINREKTSDLIIKMKEESVKYLSDNLK